MHEEQTNLTPAEAIHAQERDEQSNMNMDDINIPLVAVSVLFFGVLLAVTIVSLQAWFYGQQSSIREANVLPRDDVKTELGALWHKQRMELHNPDNAPTRSPVVTLTGTTTQATQPALKRISIDQAMASIVKNGE